MSPSPGPALAESGMFRSVAFLGGSVKDRAASQILQSRLGQSAGSAALRGEGVMKENDIVLTEGEGLESEVISFS